MIVTRKRRKTFPFRKFLVPFVIVALVVAAFAWAPSRDAIATGPLAPVWNAGAGAFGSVAAPFHFAAQNQVIGQDAQTIAKLQQQIADLQTQGSQKDKRIAQLQTSLDAANAQNVASRAPPAAGAAPTVAASGAPGYSAGDLAVGASADARRTAQNWAAMDPENAAKVVEKLPVSYVAHILALMSPDAVGPILDAVPPAFAAAVTQEHPELRR